MARKKLRPARNKNSKKDADKENKSKEDSLRNCIEEEVQLIMDIYPKSQIETVREMLLKAEDQSNRFKAVLRELSIKDKTEEPLRLSQKADVIPSSSQDTKKFSAKTFRTDEVLLINSDDDDNISENLNSFLNRLQHTPDDILPKTTKMQSRLNMEDLPAKNLRDGNLSKIEDDEDSDESSTSSSFLSKSRLEELSFPEKVSKITLLLPKADPNYLKMQVRKFENHPGKLNMFIRKAMKTPDYPQRLTGSTTQKKKILQPQLKNSSSHSNTFIGLSKRSNELETKTSKKKKPKRYDDAIDLDVLFNRRPQNLPPTRIPKSNITKIAEKDFSKKFGKVREKFPKFNINSTKKTEDNPDQIDSFDINQNRPSLEQIFQTPEQSTLSKEELKFYTTQFNVKTFLEVIPDPDTYFRENCYGKPWSTECEQYATCALFNIYKEINLQKIKECIIVAPNFLAACRMLDEVSQREDKSRFNFPMPPLVHEELLLSEIAFKTHHDEIMEFLKSQTEDFQLKIAKAKEDGSIQTCNCCYNEEILPEHMFQCEADCWFCKDCIKTSVEMSFQNGKVMFNCLNHCQAEYNFQTLEQALPAKLFSKIIIKKQAGAIENCGTENEDLSSLNPYSTQSHIPFHYEEIEQDDNVMARTYVENKMSEAVIRECHNCKMKFVKSTGCNTIACPCGTQICYVCVNPVIDLLLHRQCQRYSVIQLDEERVMKAAREAKKEVLGILNIDPTADIKTYFDNLRKINLEWKRGVEASNFLKISNENVLQIEPTEVAAKRLSKKKTQKTHVLKEPSVRRSKRLAARHSKIV